MIGKIFFCKNKYHIGVVHVPSFHLSARSSSFFRAFFLHFYGKPFHGSPHTNADDIAMTLNCSGNPTREKGKAFPTMIMFAHPKREEGANWL